jgi:hypothetical protein
MVPFVLGKCIGCGNQNGFLIPLSDEDTGERESKRFFDYLVCWKVRAEGLKIGLWLPTVFYKSVAPRARFSNHHFFTISCPFGQHKKTQPLKGCASFAWQRPTLTGTKSQLPSAQRSLTSVFGMGTGVTFLPLLPDCF